MSPWRRWILTLIAIPIIFFAAVCFIYVKHHAVSTNSCSGVDCTKIQFPSPEKMKIDSNCRQLCSTKGCILTAALLIENVDAKYSRPCVDFHSYSCGNQPLQFPGANGQLEFQIENSLLLELKNVINDISEKAIKPVREVKKFYDHCINYKSNDQLVVSGLIKVLEDTGLSGWPWLTDDWTFRVSDTKTVSFDFLLARLEMLDTHNSLSINYGINKTRTRDNFKGKIAADISIDVSTRVSMKEAYLKPEENAEVLILHKEKVKRIYDLLNVSEEDAETYATEILQLEEEIARYVQQINPDVQPHERKNLSESEWAPLVHLLLTESRVSQESLDVHILSRTGSFRRLFAKKSHRQIANYFAYRFVIARLEQLGFFFRGFLREHMPRMSVAMLGEERIKWQECVIKTTFHFEPALSNWYMSQRMSKFFVDELEHVFYRIRNVSINMLDDVSWLKEDVRNETKYYVSAVKSPTENYHLYANESFIKEIYETMKENHQDTFFENSMEFSIFKQQNYIQRRLTEGMIARLGAEGFLTANAMVEYDGSMTMGLGIIQFPYFSDMRSRPFNFGIMGYIFAHEFVHLIQIFMERAITRSGVQPREYDEYKSCVKRHYGSYKFQFFDHPLPSNVSFREDFADLLGTAVAYRAFKHAVLEDEENGIEFGVMGMDATHDQIFFLLFAQYYCQLMDENMEKIFIESGITHNPNKFRVLGTASNVKQFASAYKCAVGSPMNPLIKCNFIH